MIWKERKLFVFETYFVREKSSKRRQYGCLKDFYK